MFAYIAMKAKNSATTVKLVILTVKYLAGFYEDKRTCEVAADAENTISTAVAPVEVQSKSWEVPVAT